MFYLMNLWISKFIPLHIRHLDNSKYPKFNFDEIVRRIWTLDPLDGFEDKWALLRGILKAN